MRRSALAVLACLAPAWVSAATFNVTTLADSGTGSLRDAVAQANAAPGSDVITFGVAGTITLTTGLILITDALTIQGPGPAQLAIDGNAANRIFAIVESNAPACPALTGPTDYLVTISGLTLRNGQRNVANQVGGAIYTAKSLAINDVTFENNRARAGGALWFATQYAGQSLAVQNSRFTGNEAKDIVLGTAAANAGGAIGSAEICPPTRTMPVTMTITDSVFAGNIAQPTGFNARGGALFFNNDADITITRTTLRDNKAQLPIVPNAAVNSQGGGISGVARTLTIRDSTISNNEAQRSAALHLFNDALNRQTVQERMRVQIINSTISGNRAYELRTVLAYGNIELQLYNSTLVGNRSDQNRNSGVSLFTGPTVPASASDAALPTLGLESSVLWNPQGSSDIVKDATTIPGPVTVTANNSSVGGLCDSSCGATGIALVGTGNQVGIDPLLGPLAANGGPTQTRLPQLGSPVIGTGNNLLALPNDQRGAGFPRTIGAATDVGATEYTYSVQCDGFADVTGASPFCASVSWMKNRAVTLGCGGPNYCPDNNVSRLSMAAFMKRLGDALSGLAILRVQTSGALDFAAAPVVCQTDPIAAATAPRRAVLDAVFAGLAGTDSLARAQLVVSEDNGATWTDTQLFTVRATFRTGRWHNLHLTGHRDVESGKAVRFGVQMSLPGGPGSVTDSTCRLRIRLENSAGFTPL